MHHLEARFGGTFKMSFTNCSGGNSHSFGGEYVELKPSGLIRYTDRFDDPNLPGTLLPAPALAWQLFFALLLALEPLLTPGCAALLR